MGDEAMEIPALTSAITAHAKTDGGPDRVVLRLAAKNEDGEQQLICHLSVDEAVLFAHSLLGVVSVIIQGDGQEPEAKPPCPKCSGTGWLDGPTDDHGAATIDECPECEGKGE